MTDERTRILVAEDDRRLAAMLEQLLRSEGYEVVLAHDGQAALHAVLTRPFDLLLFDRGLPVRDGLDVLEALRAQGNAVPALILSALGNPSDRVEGLTRGAEDYLAKPFDIDELLARLRVLRRKSAAPTGGLAVPGGVLHPQRHQVDLGEGRTVVLSERENDLLAMLARRPRQVFTREELLDSVFADADDTGVVDSYVHHLRKKLGRECVLTVRGVGYALGRLP
ncbi:response regulator transcription factor [Gryllotalpicola ginsengisoli]|uniref:response regulator transcription factor n=1 Tax=Gryllotalpicola ginsengisoli TaxID=444608 RepID=UPI0003B4AEE7|nr:response regulator transcription factor [Gryllotalpicola ginsengisoli]